MTHANLVLMCRTWCGTPDEIQRGFLFFDSSAVCVTHTAHKNITRSHTNNNSAVKIHPRSISPIDFHDYMRRRRQWLRQRAPMAEQAGCRRDGFPSPEADGNPGRALTLQCSFWIICHPPSVLTSLINNSYTCKFLWDGDFTWLWIVHSPFGFVLRS